jgi:FtsP/CotA-like multicopper oxidase with cupredoxin domain
MKQRASSKRLTVKFSAMICFFACSAIAHAQCSRPKAGSEVQPPPDLTARNGILETTLFFRSSLDPYSQIRYCYVTTAGEQSPTLRVNPGDTVILHLKNEASQPSTTPQPDCTSLSMSPSSTNLHFHGLSIPPTCHQDDVLNTLLPDGSTFDYRFTIPKDQSPGLYWYHPHPHGFTEAQVLGGASGALIVNGLERGARERLLILRDQLQPGQQLNYMEPGEESEKDVSINFVPVTAPLFVPAVIEMTAGQQEFWRILNASADTYFDLQQPMDLVALDGAPLPQPSHRDHILIPPGGRAEFLVLAAPGQLISNGYDTGPDGEKSPRRILANIVTRDRPFDIRNLEPRQPAARPLPQPTRTRHLYLSEDREDKADPKYYITEEGAKPRFFDMMSDKPDITAEQGTVEDWVIENRAREAHTFHIHQLHFQLLERDGRPTSPIMMDTIDVPYWDGKGPYPSVRLRMDFRSPLISGDFVYHCHILEHEDNGMMGRIRVVDGH